MLSLCPSSASTSPFGPSRPCTSSRTCGQQPSLFQFLLWSVVEPRLTMPHGVLHLTNVNLITKPQHYFWVCLREYFWKRLVCELVDCVKKVTLTNVGWHLPMHWGPKQNKKEKEGRTCSLAELGHPPSPATGRWLSWPSGLGAWTGTCSAGSPDPRAFGFILRWHHLLAWTSGL